MGTDINPRVLIMERNNILDTILKDLKNWDGTSESGVEIVKTNEANLNRIKTINLKLIRFASTDIDYEEYTHKLNLILEEQKRFTQALKAKQNELFHNLQQLGKRKNVADNYISNKQEPIFIDKDL